MPAETNHKPRPWAVITVIGSSSQSKGAEFFIRTPIKGRLKKPTKLKNCPTNRQLIENSMILTKAASSFSTDQAFTRCCNRDGQNIAQYQSSQVSFKNRFMAAHPQMQPSFHYSSVHAPLAIRAVVNLFSRQLRILARSDL